MLYTFLFYLYIYSYISLYIILYKYTSSSHWQTYGRCDNTLLFCPAVFLTLDLSWQIQRLKTRAVGQLTRCDMTNCERYQLLSWGVEEQMKLLFDSAKCMWTADPHSLFYIQNFRCLHLSILFWSWRLLRIAIASVARKITMKRFQKWQWPTQLTLESPGTACSLAVTRAKFWRWVLFHLTRHSLERPV